MKKAFSLLEMIFAIVIIGIIASFAVPKFLDTRDSAVVSTIKRDVSSVISAVQSYHLINGDISKLSDAIDLNTTNWSVTDSKAIFKDGSNDCVTVELKLEDSNTLDITIASDAGDICTKLISKGVKTVSYNLL